jgi:hypothetical protein
MRRKLFCLFDVPPFIDSQSLKARRKCAWVNARQIRRAPFAGYPEMSLPQRVALAYAPDSDWRNRAELLGGAGRDQGVSPPQMGQEARPSPEKRCGVFGKAASP